MSKTRNKQRLAPQPSPTIRLSGLRPRLDQLLRGDMMEGDDAAIIETLDSLTSGLKPAAFLPMLLAAYSAAPPMPQAHLAALLPAWLGRGGHVQVLRGLVAQHTLAPDQQQLALAWLEAGGEPTDDIAAELASWNPFYGAYEVGNEFQSSLMIFSYANPRRLRVQALGFLVDTQPPWEGAVKDVLRQGQRPPEHAIEQYLSVWSERGEVPRPLAAAEAKRRVLDALLQNRKRRIRLPVDLIAARAQFLSDVLTLPDMPQTPAFRADDFDALAHEGNNPEALMRAERTLGYQTRAPDGSVIRMLRPADDDF